MWDLDSKNMWDLDFKNICDGWWLQMLATQNSPCKGHWFLLCFSSFIPIFYVFILIFFWHVPFFVPSVHHFCAQYLPSQNSFYQNRWFLFTQSSYDCPSPDNEMQLLASSCQSVSASIRTTLTGKFPWNFVHEIFVTIYEHIPVRLKLDKSSETFMQRCTYVYDLLSWSIL